MSGSRVPNFWWSGMGDADVWLEEPQGQAMEKVAPVAGEAGVTEAQGSGWEADREAAVEELRIWSGALPAIVYAKARPWNGRELTDDERFMAWALYEDEGPQAALEWLSENAW